MVILVVVILVVVILVVVILVVVMILVCQLIMPTLFGLGRGFPATYANKDSGKQCETQD